MDQNLKDLVESVAFIRDNMVTRDDVREIVHEVIQEDVPGIVRAIIQEEVPGIIRDETAWIRSEITELRASLEDLRLKVKDHAALTKEIDYAFQRLVVIEKRVGVVPPDEA